LEGPGRAQKTGTGKRNWNATGEGVPEGWINTQKGEKKREKGTCRTEKGVSFFYVHGTELTSIMVVEKSHNQSKLTGGGDNYKGTSKTAIKRVDIESDVIKDRWSTKEPVKYKGYPKEQIPGWLRKEPMQEKNEEEFETKTILPESGEAWTSFGRQDQEDRSDVHKRGSRGEELLRKRKKEPLQF